MQTIQFKGQTIVGVHVLTRVTDGNHVPYAEKQFFTLFNTELNSIEISKLTYESAIVGSGIRKYSGTVTRGGGRHSFYGTDVSEARKYLADEIEQMRYEQAEADNERIEHIANQMLCYLT